MADKNQSTLSLGTRSDALTWERGCSRVGLDLLTSLRKPSPTLVELKAFFKGQPSWLYMGGHFGGLKLFNHAYREGKPNAVSIKFHIDHLIVDIDGTTEKLSQSDGSFMVHKSVLVILWGGCSVCDTVRTMKVLRGLFGPHVLLGFAGETGSAMVDAMLGNGFIKKNHFFNNVQGKTDDLDAISQAWMKAANAGYATHAYADKFRAVDFGGQGWKLSDGKIVKWVTV